MRPPESRANNAPSGGATAPVSDTSPGEDAAMEVDEGAVVMPPTSPVSREDDDLLGENEAVGVEAGLAACGIKFRKETAMKCHMKTVKHQLEAKKYFITKESTEKTGTSYPNRSRFAQ